MDSLKLMDVFRRAEFRSFTPSERAAFNGVETADPQIAHVDSADGVGDQQYTVILDGSAIEILTISNCYRLEIETL